MPRASNASGRSQPILLLVTERQAYAFDLSVTFRVTIGRHDSNDLQLDSRTVSSYHAEILSSAEGTYISDLRSTNGTYVNDRRIDRQRLSSGDVIRAGSYLITVTLKRRGKRLDDFLRGKEDGSFGVGTEGRLISVRAGSEHATKTLPSRDLRDLSLADLLMIVSANELTAMLRVERSTEQGWILLDKGRILDAECGRARGEKALYRLFGWKQASWKIANRPAAPVRPTISLPTDTLIMEGMQQNEEMEKLLMVLPPLIMPLRLNGDSALPLCALSPAELEIFQTVVRHKTLGRVLEESPLTDFRVVRLVHSLLRKKLFEFSEQPSALLDRTMVFRRD